MKVIANNLNSLYTTLFLIVHYNPYIFSCRCHRLLVLYGWLCSRPSIAVDIPHIVLLLDGWLCSHYICWYHTLCLSLMVDYAPTITVDIPHIVLVLDGWLCSHYICWYHTLCLFLMVDHAPTISVDTTHCACSWWLIMLPLYCWYHTLCSFLMVYYAPTISVDTIHCARSWWLIMLPLYLLIPYIMLVLDGLLYSLNSCLLILYKLLLNVLL